MSARITVFALALALLFGCGGMAVAQEEAEKAPDVAQAWYFKVQPQMFLQFEAALKDHIAWHEKAEGVWGWNVFQVVTGPDYGTYIIRSQNVHWEDFDANEKFFRKQVMVFRLKVMPLVEAIDCRIVQVDGENSRWPEEEGKANLIEVYQYYVKPSMLNQFNEARVEFHKAIVEADWDVNYAWSFVRSGGVVPAVSLIVPHENWAGFAEPERSFKEVMTEAFGEEKANDLVAKFRGSVAKIKNFTVRYRPDLSYKPNM